MSCVQNNQCLHSLCVPNMDQRVDVDLSSCHNPEERMFGQSRYLQLMPLIEVLHFFICVIHYSYSRRVVDEILVASSMDLVILNRLLLLEQILVVTTQDSWKDVVKLFLGRFS